jgi:RNase P/RNase MRP subunit p30
MKRIFADLHLCPNPDEPDCVKGMVTKASRLGYNLIAMSLPPNLVKEKGQWLQSLCSDAGMDFVSRADLKPRTPGELINGLRKFRRTFEVIAVACESKNVARQASKDRRVDLLDFPALDFHGRFFDRAEAELASKGLAAFEVDLRPLLTLEGPPRIMLLSALRREAAIAKAFHVPVVISSGVPDESLMRKPREMAALTSLFDLGEASALKAVSETPAVIVKRNRQKLSAQFVAPGIRVVRRGKDC